MNLVVETCRAAFELRRLEARQCTLRAIEDARRRGDVAAVRDLAGVLVDNGTRRLDPDDFGPTPELLVYRRFRQRGDTIEALIRNDRLDWRQQAAALQIAEVVEAITCGSAAAMGSLQRGRVDGGGKASTPEYLARLYGDRYLPWARWMRDVRSVHQVCCGCGAAVVFDACRCGSRRLWRARPHLPLVLTVAVYGGGIEDSSIAYRMRRPRALRLLRLGLDRYADFAEGNRR